MVELSAPRWNSFGALVHGAPLCQARGPARTSARRNGRPSTPSSWTQHPPFVKSIWLLGYEGVWCYDLLWYQYIDPVESPLEEADYRDISGQACQASGSVPFSASISLYRARSTAGIRTRATLTYQAGKSTFVTHRFEKEELGKA